MSDSRYRITERIAAGGMAEVFRGIAESLQGFKKNVAIKRVLPHLTKNKKFVAMFLDEARLSLNLQHANIVQVFDIGHVDDTFFIVMEFVDGVDVKSILEWRRRINKPLTIGQTIYIIMEICKGLNYAHDLVNPENDQLMGIVHRDVSPPNVLLSKNGEIKVVDFGLAKASLQIEHTDPGVVKGKMSYLSPEAARGEEVDKRSDIFAVGILLYEMLTNKRLFYGETDYQTVELVRAAKVPPIASQNREVEPELEDITRKALARRIEDRFQNGNDLQDALAHYLFSRGLKMIQRDIADLVRKCMEDQMTLSGVARQRKVSVVDTMLQEEIRAFTSMDFEDAQAEAQAAADAAAQGAAEASQRPSGDFIDPRSWSEDADWPWRRSGQRRTSTTSTHHAALGENGQMEGPGGGPAEPRNAQGVPVQAQQAAPSSRQTSSRPGSGSMPALPARSTPSSPSARAPSGSHPSASGSAEALQQQISLSPVAPAPARGAGRGLVIGVMVVALALGAVLAALLARGG